METVMEAMFSAKISFMDKYQKIAEVNPGYLILRLWTILKMGIRV
jgi:hypothetical protein